MELLNKKARCSQAQFEEKLIQFIVLSEQPLLLVEEASFGNLLSALHPDIKLFSRGTLRRRICEYHQIYEEALRSTLQEVPGKIAISLDMWTTKTSFIPYLGVLAHWISQNWTRECVLLTFKYHPESHTGMSMADYVMKAMEKYGVTSKV